MRQRALAMLIIATVAVASCGGSDETSSQDTAEPEVASPAAVDEPEPVGGLTSQFGERYCEVLTVTVSEEGTAAEVWGTQGLNECPQEAFEQIDPAAVAAELGTTVAVKNGPRFWMLDEIVANGLAGSGELREFGGIEMRSIALVDLGAGTPDRAPFTETSVERDTVFVFAAGREVHELTAPDGSVYVMQSYSVEVDPTLAIDGLADLASTLELPDGWTFTSRVLAAPLEVEDIDGIATVIQDELNNTYQLRTRG